MANIILLENSFTSCEIEVLIGEVLEMLDAYRQVKGEKMAKSGAKGGA